MPQDVRDLIRAHMPDFPLRHSGRLVTDTTQFMTIDYGDVIALNGRHYLVLRYEAERKFGLEDPKYWVKRCRELEAGESRILKLVFHESFHELIGPVRVTSYRSETKEARILDMVRGDERFMQGFSVRDEAGNLVRVLDRIRGRRADIMVDAIEADHRTYFQDHFPGLLDKFIGCCQAIAFLHQHGEKHGDIRNDHIWVEAPTDLWRWIDFDYTYDFHENPFGLDLFGLGNILLFLVGKGVYTRSELENPDIDPKAGPNLVPGDSSLIFRSRIVNLKKLFPYIPEQLNRILMRFSCSAEVFYDSTEELLDDLAGVRALLG